MESAPGAAGGEALIVRIGGESLALPPGTVRQVLRPRPLTRLPHAPPSLLGLANHQGTVLPVVSLSRLLQRPEQPVGPDTRLVVLDRDVPVALQVDAVLGLNGNGTALTGLEALLARDFAFLTSGAQRPARPVLAGGNGATPAGSEELALLTFRVGGQDYALPLAEVAAVAPLSSSITGIPRTELAMLGVVPFRGGLLPLVSMHALLDLPAPVTSRGEARILVVRLGQASVGLVVDQAEAILRVPETSIDPVPPVLTRGRAEARVEAICRVDAGRRLISLLSPARLFDDETAARLLAEAGQEAAMDESGIERGEVERFVVFRLGAERYGLPIAAVEEVARRPSHLTRLPQAPPYLEGLMRLRSAVIPVIDQRHRFAAGEASGGAGRIIVVNVNGLRAGFAVDEVTEVLAVPVSELAPAPSLAADGAQVFDRVVTAGRDGAMILLIAPQALLDATERDLLADLTTRADAAPSSA